VRYRRSVIRTAHVLSIGSELTTGETRDTNAGDLARDLASRGVYVARLMALPDRLAPVREAVRDALRNADLVITTGGLGPTPDDLTREAIALVLGEEPHVDPDLAADLEGLFRRRGSDMPRLNLKQAWLIPSAQAIPNPLGSAPGWWVETGGRVLVALPGPPAEMWPMWRDSARPRLVSRGLGDGRVVRVLRLTGLGESLIVAALGEELFRQANPEVATYSRADAVDLRITAVPSEGRSGDELAEVVERRVRDRLGGHIFAEGADDWRAALGAALAGRRLATVEAGSGGQLAALLGGATWLVHAEVIPAARLGQLRSQARSAREGHGADVGLSLRAATRRGDTIATTVVDDAHLGVWRGRRIAFLSGDQGRRRAALAACAILLEGLRGRAQQR
jgi:nicotinamide-nucleotide amidase